MINIKAVQSVYASRGFTVNASLIITEATSGRPTALTEITDGLTVKFSLIELDTLRVFDVGSSFHPEVDLALSDISMGPYIMLIAKDNSTRVFTTNSDKGTDMLLVKQDDDGFYRLCENRRVDLTESKLTDFIDVSSFSVSEQELDKQIEVMSSKEAIERDYTNKWVPKKKDHLTIVEEAMKASLASWKGQLRISFASLDEALKDVPFNNVVSSIQLTSSDLFGISNGSLRQVLEESVHIANSNAWYKKELFLYDQELTIFYIDFCSKIRFEYQGRKITVVLDSLVTDYTAGNLDEPVLKTMAMAVIVASKLRLKHPGKKRAITRDYRSTSFNNAVGDYNTHELILKPGINLSPYGIRPEELKIFEHQESPVTRLFCNHEYFILTYIDEKFRKPRFVAFHRQSLIEFIEGTRLERYQPFSHYTAGDMVSRIFDFLRNMNTSDFKELVTTDASTRQVNKILTDINNRSNALLNLLNLTTGGI